MTEVGHMTQCDMWCIHNETSMVSLGLGGLRDGSMTEGGMSHNSIPPSMPCLEAWEGGLVHAHPSASSFGNKRRCRGGVGQDSTMPSTVELAEAVVVVNTNLVVLVQQQVAVKEWEEQEAREANVGSKLVGLL